MVDLRAVAECSQVFSSLSMWHWGLNRRQIGCCAYHMPQPLLSGLSRLAWLSSVFPALAEGVGLRASTFSQQPFACGEQLGREVLSL